MRGATACRSALPREALATASSASDACARARVLSTTERAHPVNPSPALPARKGGWRSCRFASHLDSPLPCTETVRVTDTETEQVLQNDPLAGSQRVSTVRFAVAPGWSVVSAGVSVSEVDSQGRSLSVRRWAWSVAVRGPLGALRRAAGRASSPAHARKALRAAVWTLSGGVGPRPCPEAITHPGRPGGLPVVVVCSGASWDVGRRVSSQPEALHALERLGLRRAGPVRLSPDGSHWLCVVVRSSRTTLQRLASQDRPPTRAGGPRLPPLATRWMPASGTVTLRRKARYYYDPDGWPADEPAPQEADLPPDDDGAWGQ